MTANEETPSEAGDQVALELAELRLHAEVLAARDAGEDLAVAMLERPLDTDTRKRVETYFRSDLYALAQQAYNNRRDR